MGRVRRSASIVFALGALNRCELSVGPGRDIRLPITAIDAPAEIARDSAMTVRVTVQSGGCRRLEEVRVTRAPDRATIVAHGFDTSGPGVNCPADIREDIREFRLDPPFVDPFTLVARQPAGPEMLRVVRVR